MVGLVIVNWAILVSELGIYGYHVKIEAVSDALICIFI